MPRTIACPSCERQLRLSEEQARQEVRCPVCAKTFVPNQLDEPLDALPADAIAPIPAPVDNAPPPPRWTERPTARSRPRTPVRAPRRPAPRWGTPWLLLAGLLLVVGVMVALVVWLGYREQSGSPVVRPVEDAEEARQDVRQAFHRAGPLPETELVEELTALFEDLRAAVAAGQGERAVGHFNVERMVEAMGLDSVMPPRSVARHTFVQSIRTDLVTHLNNRELVTLWDKFDIKHVRHLGDDELVVIVRHRGLDRSIVKMRWWLTGSSGPWQVYDFVDLDVGMRHSLFWGLPERMRYRGRTYDAAGDARCQEVQKAMVAVSDAKGLLGRPDLDTAERRLQSVAAIELPPQFNAQRLMTRGALLKQKHQLKEALTTLQQAQRDAPDMPYLDLLQGEVLAEMGQGARALEHLEKYQALMGEGPQLRRAMGLALRWLSRFKEAASWYRKALDENPRDAAAFVGLINSLAVNDNHGDLPARFARLDNRRGNFVTCARECIDNKNARAVELLAEVMRKSDPNFAAVDYYRALARALQNKGAEAAALFLTALEREKDPSKHREYEAGFLKAMTGPGKAVHAYGVLPESREAFRTLAHALKESHQGAELTLLVEAHGKKHGDDPLLPFYQAEAYLWEGNYALAEKAFAQALARSPNPATVAQFRPSRVLARYHARDALVAYRDIGPREETFAQLAALLLAAWDNDRLEALIDEHARHSPDSKEVLRYRSRLAVRQGKTDQGTALFKELLARPMNPQQYREAVSAFLADMIHANRAVEAYRAAPDRRAAFEELGRGLLAASRVAELRQLLEAHRAAQPDDPLLDYYAGQLYLAGSAWDRAAESLGQGWKKAGKELKPRFRWPLVYALYKGGQATRAYTEVEPRHETFTQLAYLLTSDGKGAELKQLVETHRKQAGENAVLLYHEARAELLLKHPDQAVALFQKAYNQPGAEYLRRSWVHQFVRAMAEAGPALAAYRASPDRAGGVAAAATLLLHSKRTRELVELLDEHGKTHRDDPYRLSQAGELYLLRGDLAQAEHYFAAALRQAPAQANWVYRNGLYRTRVRAGRTVATYQEAKDRRAAFIDLASVCAIAGNAGELEALIAAHRLAAPGEAELPGWEVELRWLKKDHEGVCELLAAKRTTLLLTPRWRWKFEGYLVRGLVHTKKAGQAVKEAESLARTGRSDQLLLVLAHAANGDVKQAIAAAEKLPPGPARQRCYQDEDLGPMLRTEAFQAFRERFPQTKKEPLGQW
jgi:tetratricopeptide (TPR) repeat protein